MNDTLRIGLLAISVVAASLLVTYFVVSSYQYVYLAKPDEASFYKSNFDPSKKIVFIIGSSQVWRLNMTYVNMIVSKSCEDCIVYNIAESGDNPSTRIKTLPYVISLHPKLVIYGIGYRDFSAVGSQVDNIVNFQTLQSTIFPDLQGYLHTRFLPQFGTDANPKLFTMSVMTGLTKQTHNSTGENLTSYMPFRFGITKDQYDSYNNEGLVKNNIGLSEIPTLAKIDPYSLEVNEASLEEIIRELQKDKIKVVVVTVPQSKVFLDAVSDSDKIIFNSTINEITRETGIDTYYLETKFENMTIWSDPWHVTLGNNGTVYSREMADIITKELE